MLPLRVQLLERVRVRTLEPVCRFAAGNAGISDNGRQVLLMPGDYPTMLDPGTS